MMTKIEKRLEDERCMSIELDDCLVEQQKRNTRQMFKKRSRGLIRIVQDSKMKALKQGWQTQLDFFQHQRWRWGDGKSAYIGGSISSPSTCIYHQNAIIKTLTRLPEGRRLQQAIRTLDLARRFLQRTKSSWGWSVQSSRQSLKWQTKCFQNWSRPQEYSSLKMEKSLSTVQHMHQTVRDVQG